MPAGAYPPNLPFCAKRDHFSGQFAVPQLVPLPGEVGAQCLKVVKSDIDDPVCAIRAACASRPVCDSCFPGMSAFAAPPNFAVRKLADILRGQPLVALFAPLCREAGVAGREIAEAGKHDAAIAVGASLAPVPALDRRLP
jgi:hypothetical protein